jgi:hypothetical protein
MRKLIPLAVCLLGIGTSHAGLIVDRGVDSIRTEARAALASEKLGSLTNYGEIKREYIKYSWTGRPVRPIDTVAVTTATVSVPEPGTLAMLALGLIAVGVVRRRPVR